MDFETLLARPQPSFLAGGGEMGALIRATDWSKTPLGPAESWSLSLRMMVSFLLANRFPLLLWWGPHYISIYNDAYRPILGTKHPKSMGQPVSECWSEIWHVLKPLIDTPFYGGPATWMDDIELEINRHDFIEETHFTIAYSPVPDESAPRGIGGVLATVHETTENVVSERRVHVLRDLGARPMEAKTAEEACRLVAAVLESHPRDVPFALLYLIDSETGSARLAGTAGVGHGAPISPTTIALDAAAGWPLDDALRQGEIVTVDDLGTRFAKVPTGPWSDPPDCAVVVPIRSSKADHLAGFLVAGVSARLRLDDLYCTFYELMAGQIAIAITNARAYEDERKRAEALAEIDRAKTAFFSNVSHEFRTPLTLMLGPLDELLAKPANDESRRELVVTAHRNAQRLLKLVNSLLDFSRIEAGRMQATFEPVDLSPLTKALAGSFRSAFEQAGLEFVVDCPPLREPVYVDRDMWEKIVLNLLSNAFKFTFEGGVTVSLRIDDGLAELRVEDTGVGIPDHELRRLFERFHRVEGQRSRTYEGSGIGLALVQELVRFHGGTIDAQSRAGEGTSFIVRMPFGSAHLPQDRIGTARSELAPTSVGAEVYVEQASRSMAGATAPSAEIFESDDPIDVPPPDISGYVLVADDNADMRAHLRRLLSSHFEVETVADGEAALAALRARRPDLVLTDVMMPSLDGFGLLVAIRADAALADLPVILLSARAGEEASIEGLSAGADDYLIKPFSARELIARVGAHVKMARMRKEAERQLHELNETLEEKVRERTLALAAEMAERQKTETALQQALRLEAIGHLTGGVAHDFNNLLTVVSGHADAIMSAAANPRVVQMAAVIERAADRGSRLTRQLLAFARRQQLQPTIVVFDRLVTEIDDLIRRAAGEAITVEFRPAANLWPVLVDPAQFESALLNLTMNARDAMPDGGRLTFSARNGVVNSREADRLGINPGDYVVISVTDTGTGMPPEVIAHAFEPFFTTKDIDKGTGLGLSQIYGFVKQSGGTATIESAPGAGTTVSLHLPKGEILSTAEAIPPEDAPSQNGRGKTLLIVEDQPDVREVIEMFLDGIGYRILTANDGVEAARILESEEPIDLLLTDMVMPNGISGLELAQSARRGRADLKIVLSSGYPREIGNWQDEFVFLRKPFRRQELRETIASALGFN